MAVTETTSYERTLIQGQEILVRDIISKAYHICGNRVFTVLCKPWADEPASENLVKISGGFLAVYNTYTDLYSVFHDIGPVSQMQIVNKMLYLNKIKNITTEE